MQMCLFSPINLVTPRRQMHLVDAIRWNPLTPSGRRKRNQNLKVVLDIEFEPQLEEIRARQRFEAKVIEVSRAL